MPSPALYGNLHRNSRERLDKAAKVIYNICIILLRTVQRVIRDSAACAVPHPVSFPFRQGGFFIPAP